MKITKIFLFIILFTPVVISSSETVPTLLSLSQEVYDDVTYLKLSFSALPVYEVHQFPSRSQAVVKFLSTNSLKDCKIPKTEESMLKDIRLVQNDHTLRVILNIGEGVRLRVYPIPSANEVVVELEDEKESRGLEFFSFIRRQSSGMVRINLLSLNLSNPNFHITPILARDKIPGLEATSSMVKRLGALGGINGGYFIPSGDPLGLLIIEGEMVSEPLLNRTALGYTKKGEILFGSVGFKGRVHFKPDGKILKLDGINRKAALTETVLYTHHYGAKTRRNNAGVELSVVNGRITAISSKDTAIPEDGYVLSMPNPWTTLDFSLWDEVEITYGLPPEFAGAIWAIGGGPRLVKEGKVNLTSREERFRPDIAHSCAARSAIGVTFDKRLLFVTVDQGRGSRGMRLEELAKLMVELGAKDAMNLDGGSSSTLVYRGRPVNSFSNGRERPIASALLIFDRTIH